MQRTVIGRSSSGGEYNGESPSRAATLQTQRKYWRCASGARAPATAQTPVTGRLRAQRALSAWM
eukprot:5321672-Lingulodinium_polyedra.AAC.1